MDEFPYLIDEDLLAKDVESKTQLFRNASPFPHIVIDNFLPDAHARFLRTHFPDSTHPIWLDWQKRSYSQYRKQGPGDSQRFSSLEPDFHFALQEFNSWKFLRFMEQLTGIDALLPDPYFTGGGLHQILTGGILDIHTDFNDYRRLGLYRRINALIYLNEGWEASHGGCLELWDAGAKEGRCKISIPPIFNRAVIFKTDKQSFHGHPVPWNAPNGATRKSIALYYYTAAKEVGARYDGKTDFQGVTSGPTDSADLNGGF